MGKFKITCLWGMMILIIGGSTVWGQSYKGESMRVRRVGLTKEKAGSTGEVRKPVIVVTGFSGEADTGRQIRALLALVKNYGEFEFRSISFREIEKRPKSVKGADVIWIHRIDTVFGRNYPIPDKVKDQLRDYIDQGGKLLLTMQAVHYLETLGYEEQPFQDSLKPCRDDGYGRRLGFHAFRNHPLFEELNGGSYIQKPVTDIVTPVTGFFGSTLSSSGKVIAVDWDYIFLREDSRLIHEYSVGKGKILAVGSYMDYLTPNRNADHLNKFTHNCLNYLLDKIHSKEKHYWEYATREVKVCAEPPQTDRMIKAIPASGKWSMPESELSLKRQFAGEEFWDVAGERLLVMGSEAGGIEELWAHPFMAFRDYAVGIRFSYRDTVFWLNDERPEVSVNPSDFTRLYKFQRAYLKEVIAVHPENPAGVIHYEYRGVYPAELVVTFKSNLRWMWPYSDKVTGSVCHGWLPDYQAMRFSDGSGDLNLILAGTKQPVTHRSGQFDGFRYNGKAAGFEGETTSKLQAAGLMVFPLEMNDNLDIVYTASSEGYDSTFTHFTRALYNPDEIYQAAYHHADKLLKSSLMITTPDADFNTGYRWALLATDRFFVHTPGFGKALVAGYATTRKGWDGGHAINGRPGYGWYFGRDAQWSGFALLDYGDFAKVKSQLAFFNKYQDLNGKIFHEASTSGLIHYDAADATPLYIVLAGKYFRHTNDTAFIRQSWPNIKKAINFCFSTDTDQDHLIENTNVGHGWVEGGKLYGSHSTIYMAGAWGAALREATGMAAFMKDPEAESYRLESKEQSGIINQRFWSNEKGFFAYGMDKDQTFRHVPTILPAVPVYFRMTDLEKGVLCNRQFAGNAFTTNWGARILREDNPWFKPTGYHYGSVWPLFTGWASLSEYATGNSISGYSHLMNNLNVYKNWGKGFVEEVLNGAKYEPSGVCPHQCWSETMVLQPAIEGMLGLETDARAGKLTLSPNIPSNWDSLTVRNIRVSDNLVDLQFQRLNESCEFIFNLKQGQPLRIDFFPAFAPGTEIGKIMLDGREVPAATFTMPQSQNISVSFDLVKRSVLTVENSGGINILPVIPDPRLGDNAEGIRILSSRLIKDIFHVEVEGLSGTTGELLLWAGTDYQPTTTNMVQISRDKKVTRYMVTFKPSEQKYQTEILTWKINQK